MNGWSSYLGTKGLYIYMRESGGRWQYWRERWPVAVLPCWLAYRDNRHQKQKDRRPRWSCRRGVKWRKYNNLNERDTIKIEIGGDVNRECRLKEI